MLAIVWNLVIELNQVLVHPHFGHVKFQNQARTSAGSPEDFHKHHAVPRDDDGRTRAREQRIRTVRLSWEPPYAADGSAVWSAAVATANDVPAQGHAPTDGAHAKRAGNRQLEN